VKAGVEVRDKTKIEWTDATWNPVRGCTKVSAGCDNCYAMTVAHRFAGPGQPYEGLTRTIGGRESPFRGKPTAVYIPYRTAWAVVPESDLELAVCAAPGGGDHKTRLIRPDDVATSTRGKDTNTRHVADILPETAPAHSLLVVEVITPSGCWSSYPSHKHDTDNLPHESKLEETYYHRFDPPQGFGFQRVYTDDRTLDETMTIENGDVVMVPKGYHPCGTAHGYALYYLNVMAGPKRVWKFNTEECHRWLLG